MLEVAKKLKIYQYDDLDAYLDHIDYPFVFGGVEVEDDLDDDELKDLKKIRYDFQTESITSHTLNLLSSYLSGCGGTVSFYPIPKEEVSLLKTNQSAIEWLETNLTHKELKEHHHSDDWSEMNCCIYKIGKYDFIESFLPG